MKVTFPNLPESLRTPLCDVLPLLKHELTEDGISVRIASSEQGFCVEKTRDGLCISYAQKCDFFRALTFLEQVAVQGETVCQTSRFSLLSYMADVSRNAVLNRDGFCRLVRYLALMGYNSMLLYIEDTYEIPEYPYFGHMRGRYTRDELREMDDYADSFGIELIPCIQTLAHLRSMIRWSCFQSFSDTDEILLTDDPRTYELIEAMLKTLRSCFRSNRIHVGMDEAHNLGRGKYLDKNGYRNQFDIFTGHLQKVIVLCDKYGYSPMIWSDMYFRINNQGKYSPLKPEFFQKYGDKIPQGVRFVYWDYYAIEEDFLDAMFQSHLQLPNRPVFAGGAWKWGGFAPHNKMSYFRAHHHVQACLRNGCSDVIVTGWGDNGGEASQFSTLPTLVLYAEYGYDANVSDDVIAKRFSQILGMKIDDFFALDLANDAFGARENSDDNPIKYLFYNGVFNGLLDAHVSENGASECLKASRELLKRADDPNFGYLFASLAALCYVMEKKCDLSVGIHKAYEEGKTDVLRWYAEKEIPEILSRTEDFLTLFRQQWYTENKTIGFEVQEIRIGGLKETLRSAGLRLKSYCNGEVDRIEELEQPVLHYSFDRNGNPQKTFGFNNWVRNSTASILD